MSRISRLNRRAILAFLGLGAVTSASPLAFAASKEAASALDQFLARQKDLLLPGIYEWMGGDPLRRQVELEVFGSGVFPEHQGIAVRSYCNWGGHRGHIIHTADLERGVHDRSYLGQRFRKAKEAVLPIDEKTPARAEALRTL